MVINDYCAVFQENKTIVLSHKIFKFSDSNDFGLKSMWDSIKPKRQPIILSHRTIITLNHQSISNTNMVEKQKGQLQ